MLKYAWNALTYRNWIAGYRLDRACGVYGSFLCLGRLQITLVPTAQIEVPSRRCVLGMRYLPSSTPKDVTTSLGVGERGVLKLNGCFVGRGTRLVAGNAATLAIGAGTYISDESRVYASQEIVIGEGCAISWNVTIMDDDGHGLGPPPYSNPVIIGDRVWIGCNALILKGVNIGNDSVVAAGAVVSRSCPPNSLLAGVPARIIKSNISWTDATRTLLSSNTR